MRLLWVALGLALVAPCISAQESDEWSTFMGNPERNGASGTPTEGAVSWNYAITPGLPSGEAVIEHDGLVYVTTDVDSPHGPGILALHTQDGSEAWFHPTPGVASTQGVAIAGGLVISCASQTGTKVVAVSASSGQAVWETDTGERAQAAVIVGGSKVIEPTQDGLAALNLTTGAIAWRIYDRESAMQPAYADGIVYYGGGNGTFRARALASGSLLWSENITTQRLASAPLVLDNTVYVIQGNLTALSTRTGAILWTAPLTDPLLDSPTFAAGNIVVTSGGTVSAYSLDGHLEWSTRAGQRFVYGATARGGQVVVADETGELTFLDSKTGLILSRLQTNVDGFLAPLAWDGPHIFASGLGPSATHVLEARVYAMNVPSGINNPLGVSWPEWAILGAFGIGAVALAIWLPRRWRGGP